MNGTLALGQIMNGIGLVLWSCDVPGSGWWILSGLLLVAILSVSEAA